jgi:NAD-reducing hydrogenase large subunit
MIDYHKKNKSWIDSFSVFDSNHLGLIGEDGALELYHGNLRALDSKGRAILNDIDYTDYLDHFEEDVKEWTYLKFPYLKKHGPQNGWSRVGPLARLNICDHINTPLANERLEQYRKFAGEKIINKSLYYHWARLIEMLHCLEMIETLLHDSDLQSNNLIVTGKRQKTGIGVIEAPRGTLIHHYEVSEKDEITRCNLIVSTTHNNMAMNKAVELVAKKSLEGQEKISEPMLNEIEVAIRAYDPCLSCATHAMGEMPLDVKVLDSRGHELFGRKK